MIKLRFKAYERKKNQNVMKLKFKNKIGLKINIK